MKLRNKKTGVIVDLVQGYIKDSYYGQKIEIKPVAISNKEGYIYDSLAELNSEWEDYEEPEEYWFIDYDGGIIPFSRMKETATDRMMKQIGNYFDSREEAEKAVEKLKTLTKLCKKGFEFNSVEMFGSGLIRIEASIPINEKTTLQERSNITDSLYLLFGGEE